jgi:hypothetical protein
MKVKKEAKTVNARRRHAVRANSGTHDIDVASSYTEEMNKNTVWEIRVTSCTISGYKKSSGTPVTARLRMARGR